MRSSQSSKALSCREKVMRAATQLFAARGFEGTSTRDVAKKAKVNEVTIFRLFKNKQDLYLRILDSKIGFNVPEWLHSVLRSSEDPEQVFVALAERLEKLFDPVFLRLLFYAALEKPELLRKRYGPSLLYFYKMLGRHIREGIQGDVLRDLEPALMGQALVGMIAYHCVAGELQGGDFFVPDATSSAKFYIDIWLFGASSWKAHGRQQRVPQPPESSKSAGMDLPEETS